MSGSYNLRLTDTAEADLAEVWAYLATEASEGVAAGFVASVQASCHRLLDFPLSGPPRDHLRAGLRVIFHGAYAIYYKVIEDEVLVIRVLHGARDLAAISEHGGFE